MWIGGQVAFFSLDFKKLPESKHISQIIFSFAPRVQAIIMFLVQLYSIVGYSIPKYFFSRLSSQLEVSMPDFPLCTLF